MKRSLTILAAVAVAFASFTASADTHLWLTTEGAGIEMTSEGHRPPPPPPHHKGHNHRGYCKVCKKHYKKMVKKAKKHQKKARKAQKHHNKKNHK